MTSAKETGPQTSDNFLSIQIHDERWQVAIPDLESRAQNLVSLALEDFPGEGEVCVVLANDAEVQNLNAEFRDKDAPTNVLSFPAEDEFEEDDMALADPILADLILGDVVIALETITREAKEQEKNISHHFSHMLVHGVLHLLGYDHQNDSEAGQMEDLERKILKRVGISDPYQEGSSDLKDI